MKDEFVARVGVWGQRRTTRKGYFQTCVYGHSAGMIGVIDGDLVL